MKNVVLKIAVLFVLILPCVGGTASSAGVDMKEGNWAITSETSMAMEGMSMPSMANKSTYCLTREDPVPKGKQDEECRIVHQKVTGNKVSWRMECKKGEGEGEISYHGTTYKGFFKMRVTEDGQTMKMNMKLAGKYLGPCPKGQKSGATGETAKQMAKGQEMAAQAKRQQAQMQAEQAENTKRGEALVKRSAVPAEERGACAQEGFGRTPECERKSGDLNLTPGEYEITIEKVSKAGASYTPIQVERKSVCVTSEAPVPDALGAGTPRHVKRGKEKITWTETAAGRTTRGGILYRGDSLDGALTNTMNLAPGQQVLYVTKITGRRIGDGGCVGGRDYSAKGRAYSAKRSIGDSTKKSGGDSGTHTDNILKNPVKGIRNLFGF